MPQCSKYAVRYADMIILRTAATGQKATVGVAIQFQYRRLRQSLLNVRYSASKLTPSLSRPGKLRTVEVAIQFQH